MPERNTTFLHNLFTKLLFIHFLGIFIGLRVDQIFGIFTLVLSFYTIFVYWKTKDLPFPDFPLPVEGISIYLLALWFLSIILDYYSLEWNLWDTGIFANQIVYFLENGKYYSSILNMHGFQDHFTPALLLFSPFFALKPHILWLPFFRWLFFALSVWWLFKIVKVTIKNQKWQNYLILLWLLNLSMYGVLNFEFQPSNFAPFFIFLAFYFSLEKKHLWVFTTLLFLSFFKENLVLALFTFGVYYIIYLNEKKWGIFFVFSAILLALAIYFSIPILTGGETHQKEKWGPFDYIPQKIQLVLTLAATFMFFPLLNLRLALVFIISCTLSLLSKLPTMFQLGWHYTDLPSAFAMIITVFVVKNWEQNHHSFFRKNSFKPILVILFLWLNWKTPAQHIVNLLPNAVDIKIHAEVNLLKKELPKDTIIAVQSNLGTLFMEYPNLKEFLLPDFESLESGVRPQNWPEGTFLIYAENLHSWPLEGKSLFRLTEKLRQHGFAEIKKPYLHSLKVFALH